MFSPEAEEDGTAFTVLAPRPNPPEARASIQEKTGGRKQWAMGPKSAIHPRIECHLLAYGGGDDGLPARCLWRPRLHSLSLSPSVTLDVVMARSLPQA